MDLIIHIIYVGGTVKLLLPLALTLLDHSTCRFRLVANGCSAEEVGLIEEVCHRHERLSAYIYPSDAVAAHGAVLDHLQRMERSAYFAFMDSDIFATGAFVEACMTLLETCTAVFSCPPFWQSTQELVLPPEFQYIGGGYLWSQNGRLLGNTYFAVYHNDALAAAMEALQITFMDYTWETLPVQHQQALEGLGLKAARYDTAKVLNLLLQHRGAVLVYVPISDLVHLGGISFPTFRHSPFLFRLRERLPTSIYLLWRMLNSESYRRAAPGERTRRARIFHRREAIQRYFFVLLQEGSSQEAAQYLHGLPQGLRQQVLDVGQQVQPLHARFPH